MPSIKLTTIAEGPIILKRRTGFLIPSVTFCGLHLALWTTQNVSGGVASPVALRCKRRGCKPRRASLQAAGLQAPPRFGQQIRIEIGYVK